MKLRGGIIIIGSLLWDNADRSVWRNDFLEPLETKVRVALKIRYGRESGQNRHHTYTMVFSNEPATGLGQGYILALKKKIKTKEIREILRQEAIALAKAERLWTEDSAFLGKGWGAVGLMINPGKKNNVSSIASIWSELFEEYRCDNSQNRYDHSQFAAEGEPPVIDRNGFLHIDWKPEMDDFDFLMATPTVPRPRRLLTAEEIAQKIIQGNYRTYFDNNRLSEIRTFQDEEILHHLDHR